MKKILIFSFVFILLVGIASAGNVTRFLNVTGDEVLTIDSVGNISGVGNVTFLDPINGYGLFRNLGTEINRIINGWFQNIFTSGNVTVNGSIWGRDHEESVLFSCNFDQSLVCDGGENPVNFTSEVKGIWHFEEGTGNVVADDSTEANTLTNNGADWNASGAYGSSLSFLLANTDYLVGATAGDSDFTPGTGDFSAGVWLRDAAATATMNVFGMEGTNGWRFLIRDTNGNMQFLVQDGAETATIQGSLGDATDGDWHFYIMTWDVSTGILTGYVDGVAESTATNTDVNDISPTSNIAIGRRNSGPDRYLTGTVDEPFFIKGTVLTSDEVLLLNNSRSWSNMFLDSNKGDLEQGYYSFDGNSLAYPTTMNIDKSQGTISMWIKPTWDGDDGAQHFFFDMETASNINQIRFVKTSGNNYQFIIEDENGDNAFLSVGVTSSNFPKNTWHHLAVTWNEHQPVALYLNGVVVDGIPSITGHGILQLPTTMYIGRDATSQANEANALIDDFQIRNRALNPTEIKESYEVGARNKSVTGHTANRDNNIISSYTNADSATFTTTPIELIFDATVRIGTLYSHTVDTNFTFQLTGDYLLSIDCSLDVQAGSARSVGRCYPEINDVEIDGFRMFCYNRLAGNGDQTCSGTRIISVNKGDVLDIEAVRHTGADTLQAMADGSRVTLRYIP